MRTWLITGCSTGFGRALALEVIAAGENVVATARDASTVQDLADQHPEQVEVVALDVTRPEQNAAAVDRALERFGQVDVLVNNAGYGYRAAVEEGADSDVRELFETNFFGAVDLTRRVLPSMRARRAGTIVNISSISARLTPAGSAYYSASKAALEALTLGLRAEAAPLGIRAIAVEPGAFRTDFAGRSLVGSEESLDDYEATVGPRRKANDHTHGTQLGDPVKAVRAIIAAVNSDDPPALLMLGADAVDFFRAKNAELVRDVDDWEAVSRDTAVS